MDQTAKRQELQRAKNQYEEAESDPDALCKSFSCAFDNLFSPVPNRVSRYNTHFFGVARILGVWY